MNLPRPHASAVITAMLKPDFYDHPVEQCELIETHISWVILTGAYAYKIKKPVNFGFLDFSTLEKRRYCCDEELRLNRRTAAALYLSVLAITEDKHKLVLNGVGEPVEYVVKMLQFPQQAQLDRLLAKNQLQAEHLDRIAQMVADFHQKIAIADEQSGYGTPQAVFYPVEENFTQIREQPIDQRSHERLTLVERWNHLIYAELVAEFTRRVEQGFIRECHGDLHLANLAWVDNQPIAFDCIEFNPRLRWIDVMSEVAFLTMDLQQRQQPLLAQRFINTYLEYSGDYAGLGVLTFYLCYRAMVRAKVAVLRLQQAALERQEVESLTQEFNTYLELALSYTQSEPPRVIITRGLSASGKSTVSQQMLESLPAIRIRSDIERKRMAGLWPEGNNNINETPDIYSPTYTDKTYQQLLTTADKILAAGYSVIVDATFLKFEQRQLFQLLAKKNQIPFVILELTAKPETLKNRIQARRDDISDADLKVLEHQLEHYQPLNRDEITAAIEIDTEQKVDLDRLKKKIMSLTVN